ncbi:hypothetical protein B5E53_06130 [Eubacterium sp. An11]|uniref:DUF1934 domain-containing protein n=1 Tax=Eubacterium sp. An11 TaxID=1965542 RepID=UPI000B3A3EFC|nr:DUF1934 domain-containing protein [Eubacterium sp. An11]OUQ68569.1 hypothetical protein B5E53_06130 [Eubacterium sp. An11]
MANDKKKKLHLTVRGVQRGFGQEETSEIVTFADYFTKNGKHYIFYSETTEEGQTFRNRLTISPDVVELKKSGGGDSLLRFREGHSEACVYQSPAGPMEMVSDTKRVKIHAKDDLFRLTLEYAFYMSGMLVSEYHLTVEVRPLPEE